ncbi:MAG: hypothetical protein WA702_17580 [Bradyrhizobium sp.]|uniref:hypothetical protein n=1 Tax=Bradyrhizobium sp. TaxID=376 RepID=UPI003C7C38B8
MLKYIIASIEAAQATQLKTAQYKTMFRDIGCLVSVASPSLYPEPVMSPIGPKATFPVGDGDVCFQRTTGRKPSDRQKAAFDPQRTRAASFKLEHLTA